MENLKVGDKVEVINAGIGYEKYSGQAQYMKAMYWVYGRSIENGKKGYIINIADSTLYKPDGLIALVRIENRNIEFLIGIDGLKKIEEEFKEGDPVEIIHLPYNCFYKINKCPGCDIEAKGILRKLYDDPKKLCFKHKEGKAWCSALTTEYLKKIPNTTSKYDESTTQAIIDSIKHHEDNLYKLKILVEGIFHNNEYNHSFGIGNILINYNAKSCALCKKFEDGVGICNNCPLKIIGLHCNKDNSAWKKIRNAKTKDQAITAEENMVWVLKSLIEEYKIEETHLDVLDCKVKTEVKVDKYDELRTKIEKVTAWDKEADNILEEIIKNKRCEIKFVDNSSKVGFRGYIRIEFDKQPTTQDFGYNSHCEKLEAFKKVLIYLLDHSNIKKKTLEVRECQLKKHTKQELDKIKEMFKKLQIKIEDIEKG